MQSSIVHRLAAPIVQAPMAGGPGSPALASAVAASGGLGFLAAGYLAPDALRAQLVQVRGTDRPIGVNVFCPQPLADGVDDEVRAYAAALAPLAHQHGVTLGSPRHDDDSFEAKIAVLQEERPAVVSFTFGCPPGAVVAALRAGGCEVWVSVTSRAEADQAVDAGADLLVAQGAEAGAHQGGFVDHDDEPQALHDLLAHLDGAGRPIVAAGGLMDADDIRGHVSSRHARFRERRRRHRL